MAKQKKIYWDRIFVAVIIISLLVILITTGVKSIYGYFNKSEEKTLKTNASDLSSGFTSDYKFSVCVDAGHGGEEDCGALSNDFQRYECHDDLAISLKVREQLEKQNVRVIMTRTEDVFVKLYDRPEIANKADADLLVSLHRNSAEVGSGVEIWVNSDMPEQDTLLAENILNKLDAVGISENRGVQFGYQGYDPSAGINYLVNEKTKMPSCLIELGFITDDKDNELFDKNIDLYAKAIADGIIKTAEDLNITDQK